MDGLIEIDAREWRTPLTDAEERTVGKARLRATTYPRGYYNMEGTRGNLFYKVVKGRLPVMQLQRRSGRSWKTWMVDDPLHWFAMEERVYDLPEGRILCAGLGLGLMLHHLDLRDDIKSITVVELDPDVIDLITPTLPDDDRVEIIQDDYYQYIANYDGEPYDGILWDLAVGSPAETASDFLRAEVLTAHYMPKVPLFCFGIKRKAG